MAMALQGDFYIPQCRREKCNAFLRELEQALKKQNAKLVLVTQDPLYDRVDKSFEKSYNDCAFTILHECKVFWERIQSLEGRLLTITSKVMCVNFRHDSRKQYERMERHHAFFKRLTVKEVSTEKSLKSFAADAIESLYQKYPNRRELSLDKGEEEDGSSDEEESKPDRFVKCPDLFDSTKPTNVFVLKSFLKISDKSPLQNCSSCWKCAKLAQEAKDIIPMPKLKCFFLKVLPKLYSKHDLVGLTFMSVCDNYQLADTAAFLLQLSLLQNQIQKPHERINELIVIESVLWGKLSTQRQGGDDGGNKSFTLFSKLAVTYVMVLCDFVLTCVKENKLYKADTHLDTIEGRSLSRRPIEDEKMKDICNWFDSFVKNLSQRRRESYREILKKLEIERDELCEQEEVEHVTNQPPIIQTLVAYESIREVFKSRSDDDLSFLHAYMAVSVEKCDVPAYSKALIIQGLALFVVFQLKKAAVEDVESFCDKAMKVLHNQLVSGAEKDKGLSKLKVDPLLQMLFFNPNPTIRAAAMSGRGEKLFTANRVKFVLSEASRIVFPLLAETDKIADQNKQSGTGLTWILYEGKFGECKAHLRLHIPDPRNLQDKLKTVFSDEDIFYNEMITLEKLQHKNIIKLYAFQEQYIPHFYIFEHHHNLQSALKNKTKKQAFSDKPTLVRYLTQALDAVQFCHSKGIIHRNLTAESLVLSDENNVKLTGFHLCLKMSSGEAIGKAQTNTMIPTRWSAPESLENNRYSVASDVWMFGHLMYEVLTHGGLPYADIEDSELIHQIISGKVHLSEHRLIQRVHYLLITRCTKALPEKRLSLLDVNKALEQRKEASMDSFREDQVNFDDFQDGHKPSTDHGKGIPTIPNPILKVKTAARPQVLNVGIVSDTVTKITEEHTYRFQEKLVNMSSEVRIMLRNGALTHVLPYISIKESPKEMPHAEFIIQRFSNEGQCEGVQVDTVVEGSLEKVALDKLLGTDVKPYLECLYLIAVLLEKLHRESWMIRDISMPLLHIQQRNLDEALNVYLVSVAYLQKYYPGVDSEKFSDMDAAVGPPNDPLLISRAAPEVAEFGMFSPGSDIYCFGNLIWQTLMAFSCPSDEKPTYRKEQMEAANFKRGKVSEKWEATHGRPACCPVELYDLMKDCTQHNSSERIPADKLAHQLRRVLQMM